MFFFLAIVVLTPSSRSLRLCRWVRTRWVLLALFWLGWLGMLAGAIVIIVQAPRCKPIPEMSWWNEGPLYQISNLAAFSQNGKIQGVCVCVCVCVHADKLLCIARVL